MMIFSNRKSSKFDYSQLRIDRKKKDLTELDISRAKIIPIE